MTIYRSDVRDPLPGVKEWTAALELTRVGREWIGPCPLCGGEDRFHVRESEGRGVVGCRGCIDGQSSGERAKRFGELLKAVFPARGGGVARFPAPAPRTRPDPVNGHEAAHRAIAGRLWAAAVPADDTPARAYLAGRWVWPPDGIGPSLPASVRWLPRGAVGRDVAADWYGVPEHTAGALVFAYRLPGGDLAAVELEALLTDGTRPDPRWRKTYGPRTGAAFEAAAGGRETVLCEGAVTALAARWLHPDCRVLATGGTSGLEAVARQVKGRLVLKVDGDAAGQAMMARIQAARPLGEVQAAFSPPGQDSVDEWTGTVVERAAIMEFDGGLSRTEADRAAWGEHLKGGNA